jgi:hypothetical protein
VDFAGADLEVDTPEDLLALGLYLEILDVEHALTY